MLHFVQNYRDISFKEWNVYLENSRCAIYIISLSDWEPNLCYIYNLQEVKIDKYL